MKKKKEESFGVDILRVIIKGVICMLVIASLFVWLVIIPMIHKQQEENQQSIEAIIIP